MTKIEWTNETWNPIIGCTKVSEGCKECYAEKMAKRLTAIEANRHTYNYGFVINESGKWNGKTNFVRTALKKPLSWKKPRMIFVCSMGDLFHETVSFEDIIEVFHIINKCPQHTFQILTKRADRMKEFFVDYAPNPYWENLPNVWLGVTMENQENNRLTTLLQIPAAIHFVSFEPLLGLIDFYEIIMNNEYHCNTENKLDWVIAGGESGHKARPMHPDWVRSLKDQCEAANVPFFFKQWGEWIDIDNGYDCINESEKVFIKHTFGSAYTSHDVYKIGKKKAGSILDGKEYKQFPNTTPTHSPLEKGARGIEIHTNQY